MVSLQEHRITEINRDAYWYFKGEKEEKRGYTVTVLAIVDSCTKKTSTQINEPPDFHCYLKVTVCINFVSH